jgi:hypothetical protein
MLSKVFRNTKMSSQPQLSKPLMAITYFPSECIHKTFLKGIVNFSEAEGRPSMLGKGAQRQFSPDF